MHPFEFNRWSFHKGYNGELFFGGMKGVNAVWPEEVFDNPHPPEVVLTGLRVFNEPVVPGPDSPLSTSIMEAEAIELAPDQNDVVFEYVGLHFRNPAKNQYRYRLEGYDDAWIDAGTQRQARYTNVSPGDYTFRVTAANSDGVWNEEGVSIAMTVLPPWWQTSWAYAVYVLLFAAGVFAVDRIQRRRLIRKEREQAQRREAELLRAHERELQAQNALLEEQKQRLVELDAAKGRFFANLSHELRTPLTLLLDPIERALRTDDGQTRLQRRLPVMHRNAQRLLRLIDQLLDLARLESATLTLTARRFDLVAFVERLVMAFTARAEAERITLQLVPEVAACAIYADPDKLEKVLTNLIANAFKFTPEGGRIRLRVFLDDDREAVVEVRDTGQGIAPAELPRIFDRFYQVDASATRRRSGVGIGLALSKELIELHGGRIEVESEVGFGTLAQVRLPLGRAHLPPGSVVEDPEAELPEPALHGPVPERAAEDAPTVPDGDGALDEAPEGAPLVLIVEDNAELRAYVREHLAERYTVIEAADGAEGLAAAQDRAPDLIIADVMMPKMDGFDLCRAIKTDAALGHVPLILLTARADEESKLEGLETGADDYLAKPFSMDELLVRVENLIEVRRLLRRQFSEKVVIGPHAVVAPSQEAVFVEQVRQVVEAHLGDPNFTVDWLAQEVGVSTRHLRRKLRALTELTPAGYVRMMRLERAAQLLRQDAGNVSEVAYAVGFQDAAYFSRLFKQAFGVAPSAFAAEYE